MNKKIRTALGIVAGILVGGLVNGGLIAIGPIVVPPPAGVDMTTVEGMSAGMHLLGPLNFIVPFLAHALGTLLGALVAFSLVTAHKKVAAYFVGAFYLLGGMVASSMIPAPVWFILLDLIVAYLPMAWLACRIGEAIEAPQAGETHL